METQQQTSKVVEGVVTNICERLGPGAREHIGLDQLRASAKDWMENTCSVSEAIEAIAAPLHQHVRGKLAEKNIAVQKIKDELEKTSEEIMIVEKIRKKLEQETKHLQGASGQTVDEPRTAEPCATKHLEATRAEGDSLVRNNQVDSDDDDDVVVIKTVPSKPPTLILLTDDSSEATSSSSSDDTSASSSDDVSSSTSECKSSSTSDDSVSVVRRWTESRDNPKPSTSMAGLDAVELEMATGFATQHRLIRERAMDLQDAENKGFTNMSLANLHQDELTLNERIKEIKSEEKRNVDHIAQEVKDMKTEAQTKDRMEIDGLQQHLIANVVDAIGGGGGGRDQAALNLLTDHLKPPSPNLPTAANLDMCVDENSNSTSVADIADFLSRLHPVGVHSNEMWEDAHYICSLLPYFSLRDVYQSMVDNIDHPDRRAFVLESYINLAVDRQETVQDVVFQGLWAARKRSHGEMAEPHTQVKKKRRTEHDPEANAKGVKQPVNLPQEVLPSTSKAGHFPVVISEPEPEVASGSSVTDFEFKFEDPASKKWYQAKMDFICAVVSGVERDMLWGQVVSCQTDADIEALIERLMEEHVDKPANPPAVPHPAENQPSTSADQSVAVAVAGPSNVNAATGEGGGYEAATGEGGGYEAATGEGGSDEAVAGPSSEDATEDPGSQPSDLEDRIATQVKTLSEMFADADPDYLQERCVSVNGDEAKFQEVLEELLKHKDYPKIEEYHKRQKRLEIKKKFIEGMSVEEFLEYFEDPEKVFSDTNTHMSHTYIENVRTQLKKDLPFHLIRDIENAFKKHNFHYLPTLRALQENTKLTRRKTKRFGNLKERDLDDIFIKELCYVRMQAEIKEHLWKKEENKRRSFLLAKASHQLQECQCCYDDEVLQDDMEPCSAQHKFCVNCIRRFVEEEIGQGRTSFRCLQGECKAEFSLTTLQKVMKPSIFSKILERKQLEEIAAADIDDLVACPFCNFQTIMPNPEDKVFKCLNPECMKDSCRYCKEPNHVPLHCEEVEKQHQKDTRVFLENKMTEAMVRECWKCKKRFIKEDGCNKMVCSCGAMMCYICKKPIKGYDHFEDNPKPTDPRKCPLWSNSKALHAEEVGAAAAKLKQDLDPSVTLLHNPLQDLPEVPQHVTKHRAGGGHPAQHPRAPPAHQQQVRAHPAVAYHRHHVAHIPHRNPAAFHLPAPPPPPAHHHPPPAPPAHRQLPPALAAGVMRNAPIVDRPDANQFQHQHHHHFHHHHIHPIRQNNPPVPLPPLVAHIADVFHMEMRRDHDRAYDRHLRARWEALDQIQEAQHQLHQQQQQLQQQLPPHQQQQQQQQHHQQQHHELGHPYTR